MAFTSVELAARIERAEASLVASCTRVVEARRPEVGARVETVGASLEGGAACFSGADSPLTKLVGMGFSDLPDEAFLERVEREFRAAGAPVQAEVSTLADPQLVARLTRRGYALVGFENVMGRVLTRDPLSGVATVTVETSPEEELERWIDVLVTGFSAPDDQGVASAESFPREALERAMRDMAGAGGFTRYVARTERGPAGGGSLRIDEGVAQLCGASTLPAERRRGVQTALLARRLEDATRAGCDVAVMTVQPGSKSCENACRQGFELLYPRAVLVREV